MILRILMYKNLQLKAYCNPQFDDHAPEDCATQLTRSLIIAEYEKIKHLKHYQLWYIGDFDDTTGIITQKEPELLVDIDDVLASRKEEEDGK